MALHVVCDGCQRSICPDHARENCTCMRIATVSVHQYHPDQDSQGMLTFCGWPCLGTYAAARVLVESAGEG